MKVFFFIIAAVLSVPVHAQQVDAPLSFQAPAQANTSTRVFPIMPNEYVRDGGKYVQRLGTKETEIVLQKPLPLDKKKRDEQEEGAIELRPKAMPMPRVIYPQRRSIPLTGIRKDSVENNIKSPPVKNATTPANPSRSSAIISIYSDDSSGGN